MNPDSPAATAHEDELLRRIADLEGQLDAIHRSKMWRLWMASIAFRRGLGRPFVALAAAPRWLLKAAAAMVSLLLLRPLGSLGKLAAWGLRGFAAAGCWLFLLAGTASRLLAAQLRRSVRPAELSLHTETDALSAEGRRPRVLIVCPYPIHPPNHGGGVRLSNLVRLLSKEVDLFLLIFVQARDDPPQREALEPYCRGVFFHHWQPTFERPPWRLTPPNADLFSSDRARAQIRDIVESEGIDVVQLEYTELGQYRWPGNDVKTILVEHDVAFRSFWRRRRLGFAERFPDSRAFGATFADWMRILRYEVKACRAVDAIHTMSPEDGTYLAAFLGDGTQRMRVVPNAVDVAYYQPPEDHFDERQSVLFVGNFQNLPNVDALDYFLAEIWPQVRERRPEADLSLVGAKMSDEILALDGQDGITVVGEVPDMRPSYHRHRLLAAPIRAGSGTRLKLFEAFAAGIPVVSTTLGAEGIDYVDGTHLLIADDAKAFTEAVLRLLTDDELHRSISEAALELVRAKYDWSRSAQANLFNIRRLAGPPQPRRGHRAEVPERRRDDCDISIVIPTLNGGKLLGDCLDTIAAQEIDRPYEVVLVDSGSGQADLETMQRERKTVSEKRLPVHIHAISKKDFNHGLTRDLGAALTAGDVLVFLNQDAVPRDANWLSDLTAPLFADETLAAVQGGILELPHGHDDVRRFFWDSCGERFYFTRESERWLGRYGGMGFSTVNAAIRRAVWEEIPFGWAPIMEDKKWQREVTEAGREIVARHEAAVHHTHDYDLRSLRRRCASEGLGWRLLGERYGFTDMLRDMAQPHVYRELLRGLSGGRVKKSAEFFFPLLRPWMLWVGNRWSRDVAL